MRTAFGCARCCLVLPRVSGSHIGWPKPGDLVSADPSLDSHDSVLRTIGGVSDATLMVGDIRVDGVIDGEGRFEPTKTFRGTTDEMWDSHRDLLDENGRLPFSMGTFVVRSAGHVVLVDSGLGNATLMGIEGGAMIDNLAALGLTPEDVTDVIYTHLHADHIGWSTVEGVSTFPNATHRCHQADWQHFMEGHQRHRRRVPRLGRCTPKRLPSPEPHRRSVRDLRQRWSAAARNRHPCCTGSHTG